MSHHLYDSVEPNVITEEMLLLAVDEQGPKGQAGRIAREEGIHFHDVKQLDLDYRNVWKIENLWQFTSLTRLQLDNNMIEKIEGLECLVHLIWLDLSFNKIEVIEGLNMLVKLEDLSFYHNRISKIENMDHQKNLQFLSVGHNNVDQLESIVYLRRLSKLETLCLAGNPVEQIQDYKLFVAAYLPKLVYLNYKLLDSETRRLASVEYQYIIEEMNEDERTLRKKRTQEQKEDAVLQKHKEAFVEHLNGSFLFDSMFAEDTEGKKLVQLPDVAPLLVTLQSKFVELCQEIFDTGLKEHLRRQEEVTAYNEGWHAAVKMNQELGAKKVFKFDKLKEQFHKEVHQITDNQKLKIRIAEYQSDIVELHDFLMMLEKQLLEQLKDINEEFEKNITEMTASFIEFVQGITAQLRDLENYHHEKVLESATNTLERAKRNEFDEDLPKEVRMLFVDKDTIMNAVSSSHDLHLLKIDNREDSLVTRANKWCTGLITQVHREEKSRNRNRVSEIHQYVQHLRAAAIKRIMLEE
ncbi:dynein regulatory complex subunit 3-like [Erpetoichthys calabaricus]|uniref:dynein regulatory complex subunit 3-like n=1 Tax=Erpetoichthys calabaricus TaxID=27687 RepID=UPI00109F931C|nr:dynein regulatory complex subunit 3-like [Erpetoichthys calabaricus]